VGRRPLIAVPPLATTALLGWINAEGFLGFRPTVIDTEGPDPRDIGFAKWLVEADKVVLSSAPRPRALGTHDDRRQADRRGDHGPAACEHGTVSVVYDRSRRP